LTTARSRKPSTSGAGVPACDCNQPDLPLTPAPPDRSRSAKSGRIL
jgi:hypothetical protein